MRLQLDEGFSTVSFLRRFARGSCAQCRQNKAARALSRERDVGWRALMAFFAVTGCASLALTGFLTAAAADPVEDFYRGKQIRVVIRASPGGNYDLYSRLLIRHMVRFIPGQPSALPVNMPGGSGLTALAYVADVHPKDGTVLTMVTQSFPLEQALGLNDKLKVDMRALNWIGNISEASNFLLTSAKSSTRTFEDARRRETIIGVPSVADPTAWLTQLTNAMLATRFKLVPGYTSGPDMNLAMERGEIDGRGTSNPAAMLPGGRNVGPNGAPLFHFLLQWGLRKNDDYGPVPLLADVAIDARQKIVFDFISKVASLARPIATNTGVPRERVEALRRAFDATMRDPQFLGEARRQALEVSPMSGKAVQQLVGEIVDAPASVVAIMREVLK
jgi:tripartite-type tricarboxylate transporter receptor subunit TctC